MRSSPVSPRAAALCALCAWLAWQILARSLSEYLAGHAPLAALELQPANSAALVTLAEHQFPKVLAVLSAPGASAPPRADAPETQAQQPEARFPASPESEAPAPALRFSPENAASADAKEELNVRLREAIRSDPLYAKPFRILGQLAAAEGSVDRADAFMETAAALSYRESLALYWLMQRSYATGDYTKAAFFADAVLRARPQAVAAVISTLAGMAQKRDAAQALIEVMAGNPPWRAEALSNLAQHLTDKAAVLSLLVALKDTPSPPEIPDFKDYLLHLIAQKQFDLAYYAWLQLIPPSLLNQAGLLFNAGFDTQPSGLPFDWSVAPGAGAIVDFAPHPDEEGTRALFIEFEQGRVEFPPIKQLLMLPPGLYQFQGQYKGVLTGRRGLRWRFACAEEEATALGQSEIMSSTPHAAWQPFEVTFQVPAASCRAQTAALLLDARSASEHLIAGSILYAHLRLIRVPDAAAAR